MIVFLWKHFMTLWQTLFPLDHTCEGIAERHRFEQENHPRELHPDQSLPCWRHLVNWSIASFILTDRQWSLIRNSLFVLHSKSSEAKKLPKLGLQTFPDKLYVTRLSVAECSLLHNDAFTAWQWTSIVSHLHVCLVQACPISAGAGPPGPQTEPQLHHCRKTEEGPRCAERAFQTSRALMLWARRETHRPLWNSFKC